MVYSHLKRYLNVVLVRKSKLKYLTAFRLARVKKRSITLLEKKSCIAGGNVNYPGL